MTPSRRGPLGGVLAALLVAAAVACGDDATGPGFEDPASVSYAAEFVTADSTDTLSVDLALMTRTADGVYYQDLVVGTGDSAVVGDTMYVSYNGWLRDGLLFDSGEFSFIWYDGRTAIGGMHLGTAGQQVGGERLLVIPPDWAYGNAALGPIYPGAVLVFDVVLDSIHPGP